MTMEVLYLYSVFIADRSGWVADVERFKNKFNHGHWLIEGCCRDIYNARENINALKEITITQINLLSAKN